MKADIYRNVERPKFLQYRVQHGGKSCQGTLDIADIHDEAIILFMGETNKCLLLLEEAERENGSL